LPFEKAGEAEKSGIGGTLNYVGEFLNLYVLIRNFRRAITPSARCRP
jgi:hypothetical protein